MKRLEFSYNLIENIVDNNDVPLYIIDKKTKKRHIANKIEIYHIKKHLKNKYVGSFIQRKNKENLRGLEEIERIINKYLYKNCVRDVDWRIIYEDGLRIHKGFFSKNNYK